MEDAAQAILALAAGNLETGYSSFLRGNVAPGKIAGPENHGAEPPRLR